MIASPHNAVIARAPDPSKAVLHGATGDWNQSIGQSPARSSIPTYMEIGFVPLFNDFAVMNHDFNTDIESRALSTQSYLLSFFQLGQFIGVFRPERA